MFRVDMKYDSRILFVKLKGNLERKVCYKINNYIVPVVLKHKIKYLIFNLKELVDIDESGLDSLLNTKCAIKANKGKICLCEVSSDIKEKIKRLRIKTTSTESTAERLINI